MLGIGKNRKQNRWELWLRNGDILRPHVFQQVLQEEIKNGKKDLYIPLDWATRHGQGAEAWDAEMDFSQGVSLSTLQDVQEAFQGIDWQAHCMYLDAGAEGAPLLAMLSAWQRANGMKFPLTGIIGADPLGVLAAEGHLPLSMPELYDEMAAGVLWTKAHWPVVKTLLVSTRPYGEGGASLAMEIGYALATAMEYTRELLERKIPLAAILPQICFVNSLDDPTGDGLFYSFTQRLWNFLVEKFLQEKKPARMRVIRLSLPSLIFDGEEELEMAKKAWKIFEGIEAAGGMYTALTHGLIAQEIAESLEQGYIQYAAEQGEVISWESYQELLLHSPQQEGPRLRNEVKKERLLEIQAYQADLDEQQKKDALEKVSPKLFSPSGDLIHRLAEAFFAGASLAEVMIALHAGRPDLRRDCQIRKNCLSQRLELFYQQQRKGHRLTKKKMCCSIENVECS